MKLPYSSHRDVLVLLFLIVCVLTPGCAKTKQLAVETAPAYQPPPPPTVAVPTVVPAKLNEVQNVITRVFKGAAILDTTVKPGFIAGDFNGDLTQDIAIAIKPAPGKLENLNEEYPPFLLRDPLAPEDTKAGSLRVVENEPLLAIIHGYGENDWRDPQATQTFVLKNVVASNMEVYAGKEFVKVNKGKKLPPIHGDLISNVVRTRGYIYYGTGSYRWFDLDAYRGEQPRGAFHGMARR